MRKLLFVSLFVLLAACNGKPVAPKPPVVDTVTVVDTVIVTDSSKDCDHDKDHKKLPRKPKKCESS